MLMCARRVESLKSQPKRGGAEAKAPSNLAPWPAFHVIQAETCVAEDGKESTREEFMEWFGHNAKYKWEEAQTESV